MTGSVNPDTAVIPREPDDTTLACVKAAINEVGDGFIVHARHALAAYKAVVTYGAKQLAAAPVLPGQQVPNPYISQYGHAVSWPDSALVKWHEKAMMIYREAVTALSERHFRDAQQCEVRLSNHLMSIPFTVPPGYELVRKADSTSLPAPRNEGET